MTDNKITAGSLICFSEGEYSDYGYTGHFLTLQEITNEHFQQAKEVAETRHAASSEAQRRWRGGGMVGDYPRSIDKSQAFISELIRSGLLLSINVLEIHLGSYGDLDAKI